MIVSDPRVNVRKVKVGVASTSRKNFCSAKFLPNFPNLIKRKETNNNLITNNNDQEYKHQLALITIPITLISLSFLGRNFCIQISFDVKEKKRITT